MSVRAIWMVPLMFGLGCGDAGLPGGFAPDGGRADGGSRDGGARDGGGLPDGGSIDGGGGTADGGSIDGGGTADGGFSIDGGPSVDGGAGADGGVPTDGGGMTSDGGAATDGGAVIDGGACDDRTVTEPARCADESFPSLTIEDWNDEFQSALLFGGSPRHRCIDTIQNPDKQQWIVGKFAYGTNDDDLEGEKVEVWVRRMGSAGACTWELLGSGNTTEDSLIGGPAPYDTTPLRDKGMGRDLTDDGGRVFFQIPTDRRLAAGAHPIRMVVKGDLSKAHCTLHVWPSGTRAFVSDIDGTITTSENDGLWTLLDPASPEPRPSTQEVHRTYVSKGYKLVYLTARPEMLLNGTRGWFASNSYPFAAIHLSQSNFGEFGSAAIDYKATYLEALRDDQGVIWEWAYGNKDSDLAAYLRAGVTPSHIYLVAGEYDGDLMGSNRIEGYPQEIARVACLPLAAQP